MPDEIKNKKLEQVSGGENSIDQKEEWICFTCGKKFEGKPQFRLKGDPPMSPPEMCFCLECAKRCWINDRAHEINDLDSLKISGGRGEQNKLCECQFCKKKFKKRRDDDIERNPFTPMPSEYWLTHTCRECELAMHAGRNQK